jgi:seryl-tRNA synthetase
MSKEFDQIIKEINKQNKELHNLDNQINKEIVKDIFEIKKSIKLLDNKISKIDETIEKVYQLLNTITVFIENAEDINDTMDDDDEEDWTPYDERNFGYDDNDHEDIGGDNYWSSNEDES